MDIILHNFIADMPGPYFLGFYALTIIATLILCWILNYVADYSRFLPTPPIPKQPDPYEIAYLCDGEQGVVEVVVFNLIKRGFLEIDNSKQKIQQTTIGISSASQLSLMEHCVFDWFAQPRTGQEVASIELPSILIRKRSCAGYQRHLEKKRLLTRFGMMSIITHWLILLLGVLIVVGLGGYKLCVAVIKGHSNVIFLILMGIIAVLMLVTICKDPPLPRLSARGRNYLGQLQIAFGSLKNQIRSETKAGNDDTAYLLAIGLFGTVVLIQTPYADYDRILHPVITSSSRSSGYGSSRSSGNGVSSNGGCGGGGCGSGGHGGCGGHGGGGHGGCGGCGGHGGH
jgi:uncharacterized protein (TIGR04222 family)